MTQSPLTSSSSASDISDTARRQHAINNRIQAILLGLGLLARSDDAEVRLIARELRAELDDLYTLLNQSQ